MWRARPAEPVVTVHRGTHPAILESGRAVFLSGHPAAVSAFSTDLLRLAGTHPHGYAVFALRIRQYLDRGAGTGWLNRADASVFVGFALALLSPGRHA